MNLISLIKSDIIIDLVLAICLDSSPDLQGSFKFEINQIIFVN